MRGSLHDQQIAREYVSSHYIDFNNMCTTFRDHLEHLGEAIRGSRQFLTHHPHALLIFPHPEKPDALFHRSLETVGAFIQCIQKQDLDGVRKHFLMNHLSMMMSNSWLEP